MPRDSIFNGDQMYMKRPIYYQIHVTVNASS